MRARLLDDNVLLYATLDYETEPIFRLPKGIELEITQIVEKDNASWFAVCLPDQQTGFISYKTEIFQIRQLVLVSKQAAVYAAPASNIVRYTLQAGAVFTCFDEVSNQGDKWLYIVDQAGSWGFLLATTKMKRVDPILKVAHDVPQSTAVRNMVLGGLWAVGGTIVTIWSFMQPDRDGKSVIAWGAILFGIAQFVNGINQFMHRAHQSESAS